MLNFLEMNTIAGQERAGWLLRLRQLMSLQTFVVHDMLTSLVATARYLLV